MALATRPPMADPDPYYGLMVAMAVYAAVSSFWALSAEARLQRATLIFTEVVLITALVQLSGGMKSAWFMLYVAGAALASAEHGATLGLVYAGLASLCYLGLPLALGEFQKSPDQLTRIVILWLTAATGLLRQAPVQVREDRDSQSRLDQALYTARTATELKNTREQEFFAAQRKLEGLFEVSYRLAVITRLEELLTALVEVAVEQLQVQNAAVFFLRDGQVGVMQSHGLHEPAVAAMRCPLGQGFFGRLIQVDRSFHFSHLDGRAPLQPFGDLGPFEQLLPGSARVSQQPRHPNQLEFRNLLVVPLKISADRGPFGLLMIANLLVGDRFTDAHEGYLRILANTGAIAIRNIQARVELERSHYEMIQALAQAIEAKDPYTHGHVARVRMYSVRLARAMGLPPETVTDVDTAAILHDVGKISTPDHILRKPGALTDEEFEVMKEHASNSLMILRDIRSVSQEVQKMVLHHHERWDGKGYPSKLAGNDIPLGAQIISVADCYDAMTSDRPYRKGFAPEEALKRMENGFGSQFNSLILAYFFAMFEYRPRENAEAARVVDEVRRRVQENLLRTYPAAAQIPVRMDVAPETDKGPQKKMIQYDA